MSDGIYIPDAVNHFLVCMRINQVGFIVVCI